MFTVFLNWFLTSKCFVLFELTFLLRLVSLVSKSVFAIRFTCTDLAAKISAVNVLNYGVVIYLSWLWSVRIFSILLIFVSWFDFLTKLLTPSVLFSTVVNPEVVAKPLMLGILLSISLVLTL